MEHIEEAGIHSGDSACSLPPYSLDAKVIEDIRSQAISLAKELNVVGLMNVQFAVKGTDVYILEVNPRASRTVPFVSKAIGKPLAKLASKIMLGRTLHEIGFTTEVMPQHTSVKESVFPFIKFPGVDTILGPEMKSTGEVMGIDENFGKAFAKAQIAAGAKLPLKGTIFISVKDDDKKDIVGEGRPHIVDRIKSGEITMVINTSFGMKAVTDSYSIRRSALVYNVPYFTTIAAAKAASQAIVSLMEEGLNVRPVQEYLEVYSHKV